MKPFDLEKALAGEPVVTRNGKPVTELHCFKTAEGPYNVCAVVDGVVMVLTAKGVYYSVEEGRVVEHSFDLFMAPTKRVGWVNIYLDGHADGWSHCGQVVYASEEEAKDNAYRTSCSTKIVTVKVEWEE